MSDLTPRKVRPSLLERAAATYDFKADARAPYPLPAVDHPIPAIGAAEPRADLPPAQPKPARPVARQGHLAGAATIDRVMLAERGLLVPGAAVGALAEEFRLVKRQLLATARSVSKSDAELSRLLLVSSARPNDGKTYCAVNLALSLAAERDLEVLLIDADFAKPDVMAQFGLAEQAGLLDALADPSIDVEACVVRTDIPHLSLLPCGTRTPADTELVASARTGTLITQLLTADPKRLLIFDSPPVLAASPASVLAAQVGQIMLVVRADRTSESDLREAINLLDSCEHIQLLLNAVALTPGGRRFGDYYGYGQEEDAL